MSKCIFVVEDDRHVSSTICDVLEIQGYLVSHARTGKEAIEKLNGLKVKPCVILLDLMMPDMNGWQFLDFQRAHPDLNEIPVVVCSAHRDSAKAMRPTAILDKPVQLDALLKTVQEFCA